MQESLIARLIRLVDVKLESAAGEREVALQAWRAHLYERLRGGAVR